MALRHFRCHRALDVVLPPDASRRIIVTGANGSGKTSLLEALSLLAPGRGLRGAATQDLTHAEAANGSWRVTARVRTPTGPQDVVLHARGDERLGRAARAIEIDGRPARAQGALADVLSVVWFTPDTERLFVDAPAVRRRFLDRLVAASDATHARRLADHEKALSERSSLLRQRLPDTAWLDVLEAGIAAAGVAIVASRLDYVARLADAALSSPTRLPRGIPTLEGVVEAWLAEAPALEVEERIAAALAAGREDDADVGGAALGPHRSDFGVRDARTGRAGRLCSTGEQKALLISLVLAAVRLQTAERRAAPLLLLDEIAAHLDDRNRRALFEAVDHTGAQVWYSGTDLSIFASLAQDASIVTLGGG